jgi:hypothetical protein
MPRFFYFYFFYMLFLVAILFPAVWAAPLGIPLTKIVTGGLALTSQSSQNPARESGSAFTSRSSRSTSTSRSRSAWSSVTSQQFPLVSATCLDAKHWSEELPDEEPFRSDNSGSVIVSLLEPNISRSTPGRKVEFISGTTFGKSSLR